MNSAAALFILTLTFACTRGQGIGEPCRTSDGICMDYRYTVCTAGYTQGECGGGSEIRCCLDCDASCQNQETIDSGSDGQCTSLSGDCFDDTNFCDGTYQSGLCGGDSHRKCCVPKNCGTATACERSLGCMVTRAEWGARDPTSTSPTFDPLTYSFTHHTEGSFCYSISECSSVMRGIQNYHMDSNGWSDIGYNFLIGGDGLVYEGRGIGIQGAHTAGCNSQGYGTSWMGSYMTTRPPQIMKDVYADLQACLASRGNIISDYRHCGHRESGTTSTDCPGDLLFNEVVLGDVTHHKDCNC